MAGLWLMFTLAMAVVPIQKETVFEVTTHKELPKKAKDSVLVIDDIRFKVYKQKGFLLSVNRYKTKSLHDKDSVWKSDTLWLLMPDFESFYTFPEKKIDKKKVSNKVNNLKDKIKKIEQKELKKHNNEFGEELGKPNGENEVVEDGDDLQKLEFGDKGAEVLYPAFQKLAALSANKTTMHIFHYGDSQIEGDRMTSYIRNRLQNKFGGNGPGMIPAFDTYNSMSFKQSRSENWKRYNAFASVSKEVPHKKYGSMVAFARFTPFYADSLLEDLPETEAWIELSPSRSAYGNAKTYNKVRMYYGNCTSKVDLSIYNNGELIQEDTLISDGKYHFIELHFTETPNLKYVFKGKNSPDIYSFSCEGNYGVQVNNVAMRGSSGTFFGKVDQGLMQRMYNELNSDLFIMQFGGNAVPWVDSEKEADDVARFFKSQLYTIKKLRPNACIIVIGPSDMSTKIDGEMKTYPILPYVVKKMKQASLEAGAAYWDLYAAMGGENTMAYWVEQGWAGEDYTHFTPGGAKVVSEMFYEAFLLEYQKYMDTKK